jgi:pimeloyl-ACP methyl ester carboxylesterase
MPQTKIVKREEGQIAYDDTGGLGTLLVCVPGMGQLRSIYRFLAPKLKNLGYRVVTMDIRGMGESSVKWTDYSESAIASDLAALVEDLRAGPAVIMGNSISAGAAVCLAADRPELVSELVLVGPFVRQIPVSWWKGLMFKIALAGPWGLSTWINYQSMSLYPKYKPLDSSNYNLSLRKNLKEPGRMSAFRKMAISDHLAAEANLDKVRCPVSIVIGGSDPDFPDPKAEGELVARRLHGQLSYLPDLGHYPQAEQPEMFLDSISSFLRGKEERQIVS